MRHSPPQFAPSFDDFLEQLRAKGFDIGVEHHLRMRVLLERAEGEVLPGDLKTLLCPLVATNAEQQAAFYEAFEEAFPHYRETPEFAAVVEAAVEDVAVPTAVAVESPALNSPRRRGWLWPGLWGLGIVGLLVTLLWMRGPNEGDRVNQPPASEPAVGSAPVEVVQPPAGTGPALPDPPPPPEWRWWQLLAGSIPFVAWFVLEGVIRRRREASLQRRRGLRPPLSWPVNVNKTHIADHSDPQFHGLARRMQRRQASPVRELDLGATIRATIQGLGYPKLVYRSGTQAPEYLVLVERVSPQDHQAHLYSQMVRALEGEGVHIREFHFDGDPRECWKPLGGEPVSLSELHWQTGERLIVIG